LSEPYGRAGIAQSV